jgi:hypothetical protein
VKKAGPTKGSVDRPGMAIGWNGTMVGGALASGTISRKT